VRLQVSRHMSRRGSFTFGTALLSLAACAQQGGEDPSGWYGPAEPQDVEEPIAFTDDAYGFTGGIADLGSVLPVTPDGVTFAPGDGWPSGISCTAGTSSDLPMEIEGVVTIQPRFYFKTVGCTTDDEKYYGSFFLEDDDGGIFVLGDSKVAHFDPGNKVRIAVRGVRTRYGLDMIQSWEVVSVDHTPGAVHYDLAAQPLDQGDVGQVRRVTGTVSTAPDTFGEFTLTDDLGQGFDVIVDAELSRRGFLPQIGERLQVTGPVIYSFSVYSIIVMSLGQITALEP
jgi:hypothetical protein